MQLHIYLSTDECLPQLLENQTDFIRKVMASYVSRAGYQTHDRKLETTIVQRYARYGTFRSKDSFLQLLELATV